MIINRHGTVSINKNRAWHVKKKIDLNLLEKGSRIFQGTHDFSTFRASNCAAKSPVRTMKKVKITKVKNVIKIQFVSKSFLKSQVRSMVGSLKYLGEKKWNLKKFTSIFKSKSRKNCAPIAPAHGLYLEKIIY